MYDSNFVGKAIQDLLDAYLIREKSNALFVVNPLMVSISQSGKGHLILDLRHVHKQPVAVLRENSDFKEFTDASDGAAGGFVANSDYTMHNQRLQHEVIKSSTWRELKAVELSIESFKHLLSNSSVSFFADNQNVVGIIQKGSKVPELHTLALSIFNICVSFNISLYPQ
ncbi:unnamed protein product [Mytilus coruscus]|uniref:Reverse transcriptase RNase H-like domain-containing protein n=1 Tax=Mytilus coruscus TaxID=42192 RepID=A0A6J8A4H4_MYTCO|nr:unnamed protein product [Mytilus coruscus]